MDNQLITDIAAWVGAVVAVLVLAWDVYKEARNGARLRLNVSTNMRYLVAGNLSEEPHLSVQVVNEGNLPTTLTHLIVYMFDSRWKKIRKQPSLNGAVVMQPSYTPQLPHLLKPGELWQGVVSQPQLESYLNEHGNKLVYVAVAHVCSQKEVMQRVDTTRLRERLDVLGD